ncbi:Rpn family recombination-promoting nuclease/putative transposase [Treponema vincentii]|uniref:Rpn family recombination-promoting nuclease/putative transposase n=2 Tax=Treponema vincentii TaxID=69710 RepID=UPI002647CBEB|nr:Rpn family recombination-promoting nuclease/putative transposase [Treponema vincentii]
MGVIGGIFFLSEKKKIPPNFFYWAKMYIEGFKEGEPYTSLTRCIAINLISQGFKLNSEVHSAYRILEQQTYQQLTDLLEIHFLNLSAVKGTEIRQSITTKKQEKLLNWLRFIETDDKEERAMLATTSPVLQMLNEKIDILSLKPEERKLYESRMKLKSDIATISEVQFKAGIERGKSLGLAEGEARGSRQAKLETAKNLLQFGLSREKIAQATGLTTDEVDALDETHS